MNKISKVPEITRLSNGFRILTVNVPEIETTSFGLMFNSGSRFETKENNGVAHFLEHMIFRGSYKRTKSEIEEEFENMGSNLNAYTSQESTLFWSEAVPENTERTLDIVGDMIFNTRITDSAIMQERHTIVSEYEEVNSIIEEVVHDKIHEHMFQSDPLGMPILGPLENIRGGITKETLLEYRSKFFAPNNSIFSYVGPHKHKEVVDMVTRTLSKYNLKKGINGLDVLDRLSPTKIYSGRYSYEFENLPVIYFSLMMPGPSSLDLSRLLQFNIVQQLIGKDLNSTTAFVERNRQNLIDYTHYLFPYYKTGLFGFIASTFNPEMESEILKSYVETIQRLLNSDPTDLQNQIDRAKTMLKLDMSIEYDQKNTIVEDFASQVLSSREERDVFNITKTFQVIDSINYRDILRILEFVWRGLGSHCLLEVYPRQSLATATHPNV